MASTFTPNIQIEEPARGDDTGTWDTPVNNNSTLLDLVLGGITTIALNNSNVVLSAAQFKNREITFNSTLTGSVIITLPTSFTKSYEIQNLCTGSSAFTITLQTTVAGGQAICSPPGEIVDIVNDGSNIKFKNLGRVGTYWDYAGSSVPNWVSGCTVAPYLNCDGTAFSSATFPALAVVLPGLTLPNSKGRARISLDQGAGLISSATGGFSGSSVGGVGGGMTTTLGTSNLPAYTPTGTVGVSHNAQSNVGGSGTPGPFTAPLNPPGAATITATFTGIAQGGVSQAMTNLPPAYIGGLTLIRSA